MRFLAPDELPAEARRAVAALLFEEGEDPQAWRISYLWENGKRQPGFAVCFRRSEEFRAYTVVARDERYKA